MITLTTEHGQQQKQAEQEPVAWMVTTEGLDGTPKTYPLTGRYKDVRDMCDFGDPLPLYAAPVQQVELTVSDLDAIIEKHYDDEMDLKAMILDGIAAYKDKNK